MPLRCQRCNAEINEYQVTKVQKIRALSGLTEQTYALVECPDCGSTEIMSLRSKLLAGLKKSNKPPDE
jgi:DNA-directed RNA polymerase subunit RPC12/RpoP